MAPQPTMHPDVALDLALAVIASSTAPLLLLNQDLTLVAASKSFCNAFRIDPTKVAGLQLRMLGSGEWDIPQLNALLEATATGYAAVESYEIDLKRQGRDPRRLVVNAQKLEYGSGESIRLLVSVSDVTEARIAERLKDDMLKEKAVLLQELQHRVANSLQIIASVFAAKRAQGAIGGRPEATSTTHTNGSCPSQRCSNSSLPPACLMFSCGRISRRCATASVHR